jgi:tol-pal system protein YbgF
VLVRSLKILIVLAASFAMSGCYLAKVFRGPISTERTALAADTLRAEQRRIIEQLDRIEARMNRESEERTTSQAQMSVTMRELEEAVRMLVSRMEDSEQMMNNRGGRGGSSPAPPGTPDSADTGEELYRAAYLDVTRGNYELAAQVFQDYLARFPEGTHVAEAHYYLGECHFATERYLEAAGEFQRVTRDFSASRLAPAAYLKMGRAYTRLEERGLAERAFQTLIDKHPNSEEAKQAQVALQELGG